MALVRVRVKATAPTIESLSAAIRLGNVEIVKTLVVRMTSIDNATDASGMTALHIAIEVESSDIIKLLLTHMTSIDVRDKDGKTPLHQAVDANLVDVVRLLIMRFPDVDMKDKAGWTPLHRAVCADRVGIVMLLLESGADAMQRTPEGMDGLEMARTRGFRHILDLLIAKVSGEPTAAESIEYVRRPISTKDKHDCSVCWNSPTNVVLLPCGHMCTCTGCAERVASCPLCRQEIVARHRVYY